MINVGDLVWLPRRLPEDHPAYQLQEQIIGEPGHVISITDEGWAMVDRGSWGHFGEAVTDLRPAAG